MTKDFTDRRGRRQNFNKLRRKVGAILIEFAFASPVFLVLIYYIHDLPKQKLMQRKMQFIAYEMAAIIQNIAKQKNTPITREDLKNAARLAYLSHFVGPTMCSDSSDNFPYGYGLHTWTYYVVGTGNNQAQTKWLIGIWSTMNQVSAESGYGQHSGSIVKYSSSSTASSGIYPSLKISAGEVKIITEGALSNWKNKSPSSLFGFLLLSPSSYSPSKQQYYNSVAIFTPASGFSETPPR